MMTKAQAKKVVKKWRKGPGAKIVKAWKAAAVKLPYQILEGHHQGKKRRFRVNPVPPQHGSAHGSFQIWEYVEDALTPVGYSLSNPVFWDCCRIAAESGKPVHTGTYLFKEKIMTVKKKTPKQGKIALDAKHYMELGKKQEAEGKKPVPSDLPGGDGPRYRPFVAVVLQGKNGKWLYGWQDEEKKLEKQDGTFKTCQEASDAASKDHDIIINTAPAREIKNTKSTGWGGLAAPSSSSSPPPRKETKEKSTIVDGVSLKKVCAEADIDPKLARRILRSKGAKPGGRWEWKPDEVAGVVKLLKDGAAALKSKKDAPAEKKVETPAQVAQVETPKAKSTVKKKPAPAKKKAVTKKKPAKKGS